jgi:glycerol uptake facilitator-like aquaporin
MLGSALLVLIILAVTDEKNMKIPAFLAPLFIGFGLCAIHLSFGLNAGCAVNPARDFSP